MNKKIVIISTIILLIDQIIKSIIELCEIHVNIINNFLKFNYYQNTGAAFSIMQGKTNFLIIISIIMLIVIYSMTFSYTETKLTNLSFGVIIGGVLGNLVDRVFCGYVRDFIDFKIINYSFPIFNIADMAIVIGTFLLIIATFKGEIHCGNKSKRRRKQIKDR